MILRNLILSFFVFFFINIKANDFPIELEICVETLASAQLSSEERKDFENSVKKIESAKTNISEIYFQYLVKNRIYESLASLTENLKGKNSLTDSQLINLGKKEGYNLFSHWLIEALQSDLAAFKGKKTTSVPLNLSSLVTFFTSQNPTEANQIIESLLIKTLHHLAQDMQIFLLWESRESDNKTHQDSGSLRKIISESNTQQSKKSPIGNKELLQKLKEIRQKNSQSIIEKIKIDPTPISQVKKDTEDNSTPQEKIKSDTNTDVENLPWVPASIKNDAGAPESIK